VEIVSEMLGVPPVCITICCNMFNPVDYQPTFMCICLLPVN